MLLKKGEGELLPVSALKYLELAMYSFSVMPSS
jgi:hypothetical protein